MRTRVCVCGKYSIHMKMYRDVRLASTSTIVRDAYVYVHRINIHYTDIYLTEGLGNITISRFILLLMSAYVSIIQHNNNFYLSFWNSITELLFSYFYSAKTFIFFLFVFSFYFALCSFFYMYNLYTIHVCIPIGLESCTVCACNSEKKKK